MSPREERLQSEIISLIAETLSLDPNTVTPQSVVSDLSPDSIRLFELLLAFEKKYEIKTAYEDIVNLNTVGDIVLYLTKHPSTA